jgi:hypothetical protein
VVWIIIAIVALLVIGTVVLVLARRRRVPAG